MIVETLPDVQRLAPAEKLLLAVELFEDTTDCVSEAADSEIVEILERRMAEYAATPGNASPWCAVKDRILASRGK